MRITADQYPYTANSFSLTDATLPAPQIQWCKRSELGKRMASDPEFAALVRRVITEQIGRVEKIVIAASKEFPTYVGKSLKEIATQEKIDQVDLVLKIIAQGNPQVVSHSMSEDDVRWVMTLPWVATASDGSARAVNPEEHHHPRNFGTFARKIGRYAIQEKVLSLSQAIRSATGLPADIFGLAERGYLHPGYHADVVVFDPATYRDHATFDKPQEYATGVRYVFLGGQAAVDQGKPSPKLFGRALRHRSTEQPAKTTNQAAPFEMRVEAEEIVCYPPPYEVTNNGSGMYRSRDPRTDRQLRGVGRDRRFPLGPGANSSAISADRYVLHCDAASGNRLSQAADLLISDTQDGKPVARYARMSFCAKQRSHDE